MSATDRSPNPLNFRNRASWRTWLEENHRSAIEAWLVIQKVGSNLEGVRLDEAVEEALCFGWIDSKLNARDDQSYSLRFSPRKATSVWSINNIRRIKRLIETGAVTAAGMATVEAAKESGQWPAAIDRERIEEIPADLAAVLRPRKGTIAA